MANTGNLIILTLQQVEDPCTEPWTGCTCAPGCPTKPNNPSDADYIPISQNLDLCPIIYTTTCPQVVMTGLTTSILFEFSLLNSVIENPALDKVKIKAMLASVEQSQQTFNFPGPSANYFQGSLTGLVGSTSYDIVVDYLDAANAVVTSCPIASISTT